MASKYPKHRKHHTLWWNVVFIKNRRLSGKPKGFSTCSNCRSRNVSRISVGRATCVDIFLAYQPLPPLRNLKKSPRRAKRISIKRLHVIQYFLFLACGWTSHCVTGGWEASLGDNRPRKVESFAICLRKDLTGIPTYLPVKITKL